jgi:hypothetical protein
MGAKWRRASSGSPSSSSARREHAHPSRVRASAEVRSPCLAGPSCASRSRSPRTLPRLRRACVSVTAPCCRAIGGGPSGGTSAGVTKLHEVVNRRHGDEAGLLVSASRGCMRRVVPGVGRGVPHSLRRHQVQDVPVHQRADAFALLGRMDGADANAPALRLAIDLVADHADDRSSQLGDDQPPSLARPGQRAQVPPDGSSPVEVGAGKAPEGLAGRSERTEAKVEDGPPVGVDVGAHLRHSVLRTASRC